MMNFCTHPENSEPKLLTKEVMNQNNKNALATVLELKIELFSDKH